MELVCDDKIVIDYLPLYEIEISGQELEGLKIRLTNFRSEISGQENPVQNSGQEINRQPWTPFFIRRLIWSLVLVSGLLWFALVPGGLMWHEFAYGVFMTLSYEFGYKVAVEVLRRQDG